MRIVVETENIVKRDVLWATLNRTACTVWEGNRPIELVVEFAEWGKRSILDVIERHEAKIARWVFK